MPFCFTQDGRCLDGLLPGVVVEVDTIVAFKSLLDGHMDHVPGR